MLTASNVGSDQLVVNSLGFDINHFVEVKLCFRSYFYILDFSELYLADWSGYIWFFVHKWQFLLQIKGWLGCHSEV